MTAKEKQQQQQPITTTRTTSTTTNTERRRVIAPGGRLPFSPVSFLENPTATTATSHSSLSTRRAKQRILDSKDNDNNDNGYTSYLVDKDGNAYEPYSLAWRYLGMYLDCDLEEEDDDDDKENDSEEKRRYLGSGSGDDNDCERVLLWAAYVDPRYRGGSIGEYQFYDLETHSWDKSSCRTRRCARMDCHEPNSHFKLVGVFKESDGLEDWAEQLFKHEGYCLWDSDTYDIMQERREKWPTYCIQLLYTVDGDGNSLYTHLKPDKEGNITMGIYSDAKCTQESSLTFFDYVIAYFNYYYGDEDEGLEAANYWNTSITTWNTHMNTYKICQPCRAYNLGKFDDEQEEKENSKDESKDGKRRFLENNDGEGEEEQWGFNCYDDAGYKNCNQCYKFETKTNLQPVDAEDLARASKQGTILEIVVDGKRYGNGGFRNSFPDLPVTTLFIIFGVIAGGIFFFAYQNRRKVVQVFGALRESISPDKSDETAADSSGRHSKGDLENSLPSNGSFSSSSDYYSAFSDASISLMGTPWSCCAPIEMHDSFDSRSMYSGHSLSSTTFSSDLSSCEQLEGSSCDSSKRKRKRNERIKWIEFGSGLLPNNTEDSDDSTWSYLQRRILYPEETRWMDIRNRILGPSRSSLPDHHHVSELSSNTSTHSDGMTSTDYRYSHEEGHGAKIAEDTSATNATHVHCKDDNFDFQEHPDDYKVGNSSCQEQTREEEKPSTGTLLAMESIGLSGVNKNNGRTTTHTQSGTIEIGQEEFPDDEVNDGNNQEQNQEKTEESTGAISTVDEKDQSTNNEDSSSVDSRIGEDRFEKLKSKLLSTSSDLGDDSRTDESEDLFHSTSAET